MAKRCGRPEDGVRLLKSENSDPIQIKGFWSVIREGDDLKIRMHSPNVAPPDAKPSPTATPAKE